MSADGQKRCWRCKRETGPKEIKQKMMGQMYCQKCIKEMKKGCGGSHW